MMPEFVAPGSKPNPEPSEVTCPGEGEGVITGRVPDW